MDDFDGSSSDDQGIMDFVMNKDISRGAPNMNKLRHGIGKTLRPGGEKTKLKSLNLSQLGRQNKSKHQILS